MRQMAFLLLFWSDFPLKTDRSQQQESFLNVYFKVYLVGLMYNCHAFVFHAWQDMDHI